jgi:hypothetical protein
VTETLRRPFAQFILSQPCPEQALGADVEGRSSFDRAPRALRTNGSVQACPELVEEGSGRKDVLIRLSPPDTNEC